MVLSDPASPALQLLARPAVVDGRGVLTPYRFHDLPFLPVRLFTVTGVPAGTVRGGHAHRTGHQLFSCLSGAVEVNLCNAQHSWTCLLTPGAGDLHLRPGTWSSQRYLRAGSGLLVLCSEDFDPDSYLVEPMAAASL